MTQRKQPEAEVPNELRDAGGPPVAMPSTADGSPRDGVVAEAVRLMIAGIAYPVARRLRWKLNDGVLSLEGVVRSYHLKQVVCSALRKIDGVRSVVDRLEVDPATGDDGSEREA